MRHFRNAAPAGFIALLLVITSACHREVALRYELREFRVAIDDYYAVNGRYPQTLEDLVPKYMKSVPRDPITKNADWVLIRERATTRSQQGGIIDVRSSASGQMCDGRPYSDL